MFSTHLAGVIYRLSHNWLFNFSGGGTVNIDTKAEISLCYGCACSQTADRTSAAVFSHLLVPIAIALTVATATAITVAAIAVTATASTAAVASSATSAAG